MSSYNKQPESALSRSNPTWYFFSITILYIKCMDLKTWSTCISMPVFARVNHRSCISFIFTSPLQTRTLWNTMSPACMAPWRFLKPAQQSRCYQCQISDVQNPLLVIDFARLSELWSTNQYIAIRWILNTADMNRLREPMFGTLSGEQWLDS